MNLQKQKIPSFMYHSVGIENKKWHWFFLTCPYQVFESQLKWLKWMGYRTIDFQEMHDYVMLNKPMPKKSVFLTFDDGYLDNYVFAYPLLKKYGMKGTIFVNPDFVDKSNGLRKRMDQIKSNKEIEGLDTLGFCNWDELRFIDHSGVLEVQSHAKTHAWYPISDKIIDFRHPNDEYNWMSWNDYPEEKPLLQCLEPSKNKLGSAVFENEKSLSSKRVFINSEFQEKLQKFVKEKRESNFFESPDWKKELTKQADEIKKQVNPISKVETEKEYHDRIRFELEYTKTEIEKQLKKEVKFLCWPGGSATKVGVEIADELGYLMSTAARDIPHLRKKIKNSPENKINRISRLTPVMYSTLHKGGLIRYSPGWFLILQILEFQNKYKSAFFIKSFKYLIYKFT